MRKNKLLGAISKEKEKINQDLLIQSEQKDLLNEQLTARNEQLSYFAGLVAHDIKAPIRTSSGFIQLIKEHLQKDDEVSEYMEIIERSNQKLSILIDDLLLYARSGQYKEDGVPVDLNKVLETVSGNLRLQIKEKSAELSVSDLPVVLAKETEMIQLFQNIISNAIKFTEGKTPQIAIKSYVNLDEFSVIISDNGIGIANEHLHKIFEPLERIHSDSKFEGTGLGLATCKRIVEHLGGSIAVKSKLNEGSSFTIAFPLELVVHEKSGTPVRSRDAE